MFDNARAYVVSQIKGARPSFVSKTPHFNFITVHYFWIVGATMLASIAIFAGGKGALTYIDSLMFASGANTQAGLNPVDVNNLNGFQQSMIYLFAMLSNPISMHTCVVFLRLYWFEKRFQNFAQEVRSRRRTISRSKSKSRNDIGQIEAGMGVNGRRITVVPRTGKAPRLTNDGMVLDGAHETAPKPSSPKSDESDSTSATDERNAKNVELDELGPLARSNLRPPEGDVAQNGSAAEPESPKDEDAGQGHAAVTFAETVRRSDGMGSDPTKFPQRRSNAEHIAIVERQRNQDNEVLRIPGPRDAERGLGPRRLEIDDQQDEDDHPISRQRTTASRVNDSRGMQSRQPTITISEPDRPRRDDHSDDVKVDSLRFRKPRMFRRREDTLDEDDESRDMRPIRTKTLDTIRSALSRDKTEDMPYLSYTPTIGRNSNFVGLTSEQREELGGIEYRSLRTLAVVLLVYFWMFHLLGLICLLPYILHNNTYGQVLDQDHVGKVWWSFWTSNMAFMDVGFTLTPNSMNSFATSEWVLMALWFFIIIGNTGFPVMLRFMIWVASKITPKDSSLWEEFMFLLDHPRRCFTLLFPSNANWWLFWILVILNVVDLLFFIVLDLGTEPVTELPLKNRFVIGLFQAASTRTAGFTAVSLSELHPGMPVLYMIMMYISVFPIAISIRRTNVYEEKSLGVYYDRTEDDINPDASALSYVGTHLRRQLSFDLWYVFLGFFVLAITEAGKIRRGDFDMFAVLFEIVSAYGTVGLSMGVANVNASLCSQFSVPGKLVIVAMQIRGRHRGLPYGLDRAVLLPSEARFEKEAEESEAELARVSTGVSTAVTSGLQRQATSSAQSRGRSRERTNSNIITQLLHPGPVVQHDAALLRPRARSVDGHRRVRSAEVPGPLLRPMRTQTEPQADDDVEELSPLEVPNKPPRTKSSAF